MTTNKPPAQNPIAGANAMPATIWLNSLSKEELADELAKFEAGNPSPPPVLVREFSPVGPCLTLGLFVKRTAKFIFYREWKGGDTFADKVSRAGGWKVNGGDYIHTAACRSCRDHPETQYPNGYMD